MIELINLSFYLLKKSLLLKSQFLIPIFVGESGPILHEELNPARFYASKRDTWHKSERALPEAEGRRGPPEDRLNSWHGKTHWTLRRER